MNFVIDSPPTSGWQAWTGLPTAGRRGVPSYREGAKRPKACLPVGRTGWWKSLIMTLPIDYKQSIKQHVNGYLPGARVVLFGSRSRGDNNQYSDVDLLVIADQEFTPKEKITMESMICKELVKTFHLPFDVLLYSQSEVARKKEERSLILYHALKDGMEL